MGEDVSRRNKDFISVAIIVVLVLSIIASVLTQGFWLIKPQTPPPSNLQELKPVAPEGKMAELMDGGLVLGSNSSPVVIVEFSDLQCPFCRSFWEDSYPSLKSEYIDSGEVQLVYRHFPLSFHPSAEKGAEAIECAREQGNGWGFIDQAYEQQAKLGLGTVSFSTDDMKSWASQIGLNSTVFDNCLDSGKYASKVQADLTYGQSNGVQGTPSFFLGKRDGSNIVPISGAQPYGTFQATIEQLLK